VRLALDLASAHPAAAVGLHKRDAHKAFAADVASVTVYLTRAYLA